MERSRNGRRAATIRPIGAGDGTAAGQRARQRALCVAAMPDGEDLSELAELLRTAGVGVVGELIQRRERPHPDTYLGPGKVAEVGAVARACDANLIACDDELTARQERNLEQALGLPVVDRTTVILDIFASHANSAEGKLQVELAQLEYNLARMRGLWSHLDRLGGGIGPGGCKSRLPPQLIDAFAATLEETRRADLLAHVLDASAPADRTRVMQSAVERTLAEIGAGDRPRLLVLNKADLLEPGEREELRLRHPDAVLVSARTGEGLAE